MQMCSFLSLSLSFSLRFHPESFDAHMLLVRWCSRHCWNRRGHIRFERCPWRARVSSFVPSVCAGVFAIPRPVWRCVCVLLAFVCVRVYIIVLPLASVVRQIRSIASQHSKSIEVCEHWYIYYSNGRSVMWALCVDVCACVCVIWDKIHKYNRQIHTISQ